MFSLCIALLLTSSPDDQPWKCHVIDDASRGADGVRLADFNGDGLSDIVTGWEEGGAVRICLNPGPEAAHAKWPAVTVGKVRSGNGPGGQILLRPPRSALEVHSVLL